MILGLAQFGFVGTYLSEPLVRAYTTAAAAHAVVAQLKNILGVFSTRFSGPFSLLYVSTQIFIPFVVYTKIYYWPHYFFLRISKTLCSLCMQTLMDVCVQLPNTHLPTLLVSILSIIFLIIAKDLNNRYREKLPVPVPVELIIVWFIYFFVILHFLILKSLFMISISFNGY